MSLSSYPIYLSRVWVRGNKTVMVNRRNWVLPTVNVAKSNLMGQKKKKWLQIPTMKRIAREMKMKIQFALFFFQSIGFVPAGSQ